MFRIITLLGSQILEITAEVFGNRVQPTIVTYASILQRLYDDDGHHQDKMLKTEKCVFDLVYLRYRLGHRALASSSATDSPKNRTSPSASSFRTTLRTGIRNSSAASPTSSPPDADPLSMSSPPPETSSVTSSSAKSPPDSDKVRFLVRRLSSDAAVASLLAANLLFLLLPISLDDIRGVGGAVW
ncbi:bub1-related [Striga asiatica]|uniref:Bub1-related n=1 Tax=Striga asiatica TaxID=4170 RepID=A0A5A7RJM9_STRAF|nr:bub1-related [Striga asiatica]